MDGTGWTGILGQPGDFTNGTGTAEQDLVQLVYNGRERPGLAAFYTEYLPALQRLKQLWVKHGASATSFYDQYYLPAARNATGLMLGRSPMPIASQNAAGGEIQASLQLSTFGEDAAIRYTLDGSSPWPSGKQYSSGKTLTIPHGGHLRAASEIRGLELSRELTLKTDDFSHGPALQPLITFVPADWHTVGNWSHIGDAESGEVQAISSTGTLDSRLAVYKKAAFSTFDVTFEFSLHAADSTTAAFLFGVVGPEDYYTLDFPADGQQRRAENLWATISRVNGSRTGSGCFRETLVMQRVHGLTSAAGVWHMVRVKLDSLGELSVWVGDKIGHLRPLRPFGRREHGDSSLGVRPGLVGIGTYSDGAPVFGGLAITGETHSAANLNKVAWPAATSVAYRTLTEAAVWGMELNSLVRAGNGDLVGLSNNGKALGVNGVNALIRSTDRGRSFVRDNATLPWPNYLYYGASLLATATNVEAYFLGPIGAGHNSDRVLGKPFTLGRATSKDHAGKIWGPVEMLEGNVSFAEFQTADNIRIDDLAQCSLVRLKDGTLLLSATAQ
jgi:hypothetical protein